jgi:hypothetical protein
MMSRLEWMGIRFIPGLMDMMLRIGLTRGLDFLWNMYIHYYRTLNRLCEFALLLMGYGKGCQTG